MDLTLEWDGRSYSLDLDSITGKEYEEIEKVTGLLPDDFLTGIVKVEVELDDTGKPVLYPLLNGDGTPKLDGSGEPRTGPKVLRVRPPSGGACRALMWLFLRRDRQQVRLSQVDVPYAKFTAAFGEGLLKAMEDSGIEDEVEPESPAPKASENGSEPSFTETVSSTGFAVLSAGS